MVTGEAIIMFIQMKKSCAILSPPIGARPVSRPRAAALPLVTCGGQCRLLDQSGHF